MAAVSVIIPTHNRREACRRAIQSALRQSIPPYEVIVCDDNSSDRTDEMVAELSSSDRRVSYVRREGGLGGPGPTRNKALSEARGEWVAFLDDDDAWLPTKLETQLAASHGFDLVATNAYRSSGGTYFTDPPERITVERKHLLQDNPIIISSVIVKRRALSTVGGFATPAWMGAIADYDLWLRLGDVGSRMLVLGEPLITYDDAGDQRLSTAPLRMQIAVARLSMRRWLRSPSDASLGRAAVRHSIAATDFALGTIGARVRAIARR